MAATASANGVLTPFIWMCRFALVAFFLPQVYVGDGDDEINTGPEIVDETL